MPAAAHCSRRGRPGAAPWLLAAVLILALAACAAAVPPPAMPLQQQTQQAAPRYATGWVIVKLKSSTSPAPTVAAAAAAMPVAAASPLTPSKCGLAFVQPLSVGLGSSSGSPARRRLAAVAAHHRGSVPGMYRIVDGAKVPAKVAQLSALPGGCAPSGGMKPWVVCKSAGQKSSPLGVTSGIAIQLFPFARMASRALLHSCGRLVLLLLH